MSDWCIDCMKKTSCYGKLTEEDSYCKDYIEASEDEFYGE